MFASDPFQSELGYCLISIMEFSCLDTFQNKVLCNTLSLISIISIKKKKNRPLRLTLCLNCGTVLWHHYLCHASSSTVTDDDDAEETAILLAMCLFTSGTTVQHSQGYLISPKDGKQPRLSLLSRKPSRPTVSLSHWECGHHALPSLSYCRTH